MLNLECTEHQQNFVLSVSATHTTSILATHRYFYPYEGPITQMIVLQAANPWGSKFGRIPAIIFGYLETSGNVTSLEFAVCGNAEYAMSYLNPGKFPLPPTMVTLEASYTNPLSEELPARSAVRVVEGGFRVIGGT